jgi:RNA polymerase sigma-70 factor (ECF subfamily)
LSPEDEVVRVLLAQKGRLLAFLEERVGSRADAEDLLQTAMLRVLTKAHTLRSTDRVIPWFYRMLRNLLVDGHRRRAAAERALRRLDAAAKVAEGHDEPLWGQVCACVTAILPTLRPAYADILRRVEIDERPLTGVARSLGISANNASVRLLRARRALLDRLRATCGACFEHGCLDCFCRTAQAVGSGAARPPARDGETL